MRLLKYPPKHARHDTLSRTANVATNPHSWLALGLIAAAATAALAPKPAHTSADVERGSEDHITIGRQPRDAARIQAAVHMPTGIKITGVRDEGSARIGKSAIEYEHVRVTTNAAAIVTHTAAYETTVDGARVFADTPGFAASLIHENGDIAPATLTNPDSVADPKGFAQHVLVEQRGSDVEIYIPQYMTQPGQDVALLETQQAHSTDPGNGGQWNTLASGQIATFGVNDEGQWYLKSQTQTPPIVGMDTTFTNDADLHSGMK